MQLTNFDELWRAVNKINLDKVAKTELVLFENEGLDTDLSDVLQTNTGELFTILKNGDIRKTIIHICDVREYNGTYNLPRFHIFECTTISNMRKNNRISRYKKASRTDGKFWVIQGTNKSFETLQLCNRDCLSQHNHTYSMNNTVNNFDINSYLKTPLKHVMPYIDIKEDMTTIPTTYANNWSSISKDRKVYHKWICQECFCDCSNSSMKKYLHTHHINADKSNNKYENLKVLCIECHSNEFNHGHIKNNSSYQEFLRYKERL